MRVMDGIAKINSFTQYKYYSYYLRSVGKVK